MSIKGHQRKSVHELDPYFTENKTSGPTYIVTIQSHTTQQMYYLPREI